MTTDAKRPTPTLWCYQNALILFTLSEFVVICAELKFPATLTTFEYIWSVSILSCPRKKYEKKGGAQAAIVAYYCSFSIFSLLSQLVSNRSVPKKPVIVKIELKRTADVKIIPKNCLLTFLFSHKQTFSKIYALMFYYLICYRKQTAANSGGWDVKFSRNFWLIIICSLFFHNIAKVTTPFQL